ncbi:hypothetical protein LX15_005586 [Streptoalloteichus tenebrarius]|uniref:Integral membrane protein n=1 Tax=Streptoalloteichus tenebrarius (strain ATCC 17920 / DSM 40477 / JCM 4838 / CBS 697.72 / NBRC 16177 / NCIMB 11028 / NRRL B-12390 / A12253. 1 / ISP 5477) TaxID=1933 RepID=A0ABT1I256_STRSD|nr:hypothetical protein [Streptoalloteichus tenebrarius]MCP2261859.1 hypothetical protein [Streptoalloteichus tenebrarius]BFF00007.1 hypothetical protein GCM10020241_16820 [Streptoalloteichus tenebrarius]
MAGRSSRLLRLGLVRNAHAPTHLDTFVVSGVSTVLVTRGYLALTGYPRIGGRTLHIAHVLPGGLLMLVALFLLLSYVGPVVRPAAAVLGGIGFGLFIDEVGKFVTLDNDYFFRPSAAIMYVIFTSVVLAVHTLHRKRPLDPREHLANAVDHAVEGVAGGLSARRRAEAEGQLRNAGDVPGIAEAGALVAACSPDAVELPAPVLAAKQALRRAFTRLAARHAVRVAVVVLLVVQALGALAVAVQGRVEGDGTSLVGFRGVVTGSIVSALLIAGGLVRLRRDRHAAIRAFQLSVLVSLLVTQVFQFADAQFAALGGLAVDLLLLGLLGAEAERLRRLAALTTGEAAVGR